VRERLELVPVVAAVEVEGDGDGLPGILAEDAGVSVDGRHVPPRRVRGVDAGHHRTVLPRLEPVMDERSVTSGEVHDVGVVRQLLQLPGGDAGLRLEDHLGDVDRAVAHLQPLSTAHGTWRPRDDRS
jgi:hypothetical protein